jgi:uncharacterized membrane protein YeiH
METFVFIFEIVGTVAFALSGALTGLKKEMDILGVTFLGLMTAVGGGIIRDLILGITPPTTFQKPVYALVAVAVSILAFIPAIRRPLSRRQAVFDRMLLLMDSIGLGIFTVVGIKIAHAASQDYNVFLDIFVGVITGVGGGILRDVLAGNTPYIFVKHVYASASIAGAVLCTLLWDSAGGYAAMMAGAVLVVVIRLLSAHFKWNLPKAAKDER